MHFGSVDDLRDADRDDLEAIHGVGPQTSRAVDEAV
jgi:DNA integrity scanning protein DisA with diadenylate cyclase activity